MVHVLDAAVSTDTIATALQGLRGLVAEGIGAIAVGASATALLEAATVLPQLDAIALFSAKLPIGRVHYARMRVQIQMHRAEHGKMSSARDVEQLRRDAALGKVSILDWDYPTTNDRFIVEPRGPHDEAHAVIAIDRVRDFLTVALPSVDA